MKHYIDDETLQRWQNITKMSNINITKTTKHHKDDEPFTELTKHFQRWREHYKDDKTLQRWRNISQRWPNITEMTKHSKGDETWQSCNVSSHYERWQRGQNITKMTKHHKGDETLQRWQNITKMNETLTKMTKHYKES